MACLAHCHEGRATSTRITNLRWLCEAAFVKSQPFLQCCCNFFFLKLGFLPYGDVFTILTKPPHSSAGRQYRVRVRVLWYYTSQDNKAIRNKFLGKFNPPFSPFPPNQVFFSLMISVMHSYFLKLFVLHTRLEPAWFLYLDPECH